MTLDSTRPAARPTGTEPVGGPAEDVVTVLFRAHGLRLLRTAMLLTGDLATAEDVVQDAFLGLHRALPRLRDDGRIPGYLQVSVVNGCRSALRARRRAVIARMPDAQPAGSAESAVLAGEDRRAVIDALARLPSRSREVIVLRYYLDLPQAEIAAVLGISRGTVSSTISRALDRLGHELEEPI
ncbi:MAG: SigE family RNA polymerase sigma factor [Actinomycetota bacterium]|nr:SigE family RNA polymerase sigma factor [Actinomycetota bacterium]